MRRADRWMKKFRPEGPFVAARDGLPLNGKVYAVGEPVDLTGLGPRRRRTLYDAGRIMYPPQEEMVAEPSPVPPDESMPPDESEVESDEAENGIESDEAESGLEAEFEAMMEEEGETADAEAEAPRPKRATAPRKKK